MQLRSILAMGALFMSTTLISEARPLKIESFSEGRNVKVVLNMDENHFAVTGGCNTFNGKVEITDKGYFTIEPNRLATTLMACPDELQSLDNRISSFLENVPKVVRHGKRLFLVGTIEGETHSVYLPIDLDKGQYGDIEAEPYDIVFYYVSNERAICKLGHKPGHEKRCFQIRKDKDDQWEVYKGRIHGFKPEPNTEYRLRLKEYTRKDGSKRLALDMIVEQGIVEKTGGPEGRPHKLKSEDRRERLDREEGSQDRRERHKEKP